MVFSSSKNDDITLRIMEKYLCHRLKGDGMESYIDEK